MLTLYIIIIFLFQKYAVLGEKPENNPEKVANELMKTVEETISEQSNLLEQLIANILVPRIKTIKCFFLLCDNYYCNLFSTRMIKKFKLHVTYFIINVKNYEDLLAPNNKTQEALYETITEGCKFYIILMSNGIQVSRFLQFADRYRLINTRSNFLLLYDLRLFSKALHYLWTRIINVIFIREYGGTSFSGKTSWFDLSTVPFPSPIRGVFIPRRLDTWRKGQFRLGVDLFGDKTSNLLNQTMKVVTFQHIPAMTKYVTVSDDNKTDEENTVTYSGVEIEILQTLAEQMNFMTSIFEPENADEEKWGRKHDGKFSGLLGEMVKFNAEFALGDLHYTPYHLDLMDLTIPYNTECLTFLTPESSTDNSWMTLVLPFKLYMWLTIICVICVIGFIFHGFAKFERYLYENTKETESFVYKTKVISPNTEIVSEKLYTPSKELLFHKKNIQFEETVDKPMGLYLFEEKLNAILYTFSMLLLVSLPKVPDGWSLRVVIGWYFLYATLVVVSYKASMTSILTNPAPKITIDSLDELVYSDLACGGWAETVKDFFLTSLDSSSQKIGGKFEQVNDSDLAVERVAKGEFAYYENVYYLKAASVKRELRMQLQKVENNTKMKSDRNLHIMSHCVINMPISLGLQKNSPIKPKVDTFIRRVIEGGFVKKWLNDVMQPTLTSEMNIDTEESTALMTLEKLYAGICALFVGYFISSVTLGIEIAYWNFVIKKHPNFDKYSNTIHEPFHK